MKYHEHFIFDVLFISWHSHFGNGGDENDGPGPCATDDVGLVGNCGGCWIGGGCCWIGAWNGNCFCCCYLGKPLSINISMSTISNVEALAKYSHGSPKI